MDQRYPNATADEMTAMSDRTCIICREEMVPHQAGEAPVNVDGPNTTPKKLPCGHIFHFHCLRSWLERQQSCPTCRRTVLESTSVPGRPAAGPADPQQQNIGAQNQNQPGIRNPLGNPLGLVGRLFGPPAQPPNLRGQVPLPHQHDPVQNPGILAGQLPQGVVIQYHVQYQIPRNLQAQQHPPNPLQPAPPFPGFPGPDGVWQHWPGPAEQQNVLPPSGPITGNNTRAQASADVPASPPSTSEHPAASASAPSLSHTTEPLSNSNDERHSPTPSEAAALAALRRLNNGTSRSSTSRNVVSVVPRDSTNQPSRMENPLLDQPAPNSSPNPSVDVPSLIPLYDYGQSTQSTSGTTPRSGVTTSTSPRPTEINQHVTADRRNTEVGPHATHSLPGSSGSHFEDASNSHSQIPISHLPPRLTDEQLATMDRVTREAIDERLRVLEGVSGAVYRCIDDLMRMRSALPSTASTHFSQHSSPSTPSLNSRLSSLDEQIKDPTANNPQRLTALATSNVSGSGNTQPYRTTNNDEPGPSNSTSTQHQEA